MLTISTIGILWQNASGGIDMTTINVKTFNGAVIGPHDVTINIDGIDYTAVISSAVDGSYIVVTLQAGRRSATAEIPTDADAATVYLLAQLCSDTFDAGTWEMALSMQDAVAWEMTTAPIRDAARRIEIAAAPLKVRNNITDGMTAGTIRAAAVAARIDKTARNTARRAAAAGKNAGAAIEPITIGGHIYDDDIINGKLYKDAAHRRGVVEWSIKFDRALQLTVLNLSGYPGADNINAIKAAGFSWRADRAEWRRGLNKTARAAAIKLAATWIDTMDYHAAYDRRGRTK